MMADMELSALSIIEARDLLRRGEVSPLELVQAHLERIMDLDGKINSFIIVTSESALLHARHAEEDLRRGKSANGSPLGPLHGIPIALKDLYETRGVRTTAGSKFYSDYIPREDAAIVERLYAAGAISLGKLNMHEIALGLTNVNPHYGTCRNPWALERIPGGSSGGSGAALAAGLCMGSLGSDTGGSIRVPAALCGVVGLKPTFGRVSLRGVMPLSWNLDHPGPMARRVLDVAILLQAIAGYDREDPCSVDIPVDDYIAPIRDGVHGWRIALAEDEYFARTTPEVSATLRVAAEVFEDLGGDVNPVPFPGMRQAALTSGQMVISDAAILHEEKLCDHPDDFGVDVRERLQTGSETSLSAYIKARRTQGELRRRFEEFFDRYDILLLPTTAETAALIEGVDALEQARLLTRYTAPFNLAGLPAISVPCGFTPNGLPTGLQIVSRPWAEARVLRAAYAYEQATEWHLRRPTL